jgi:hypothetical protein
MYRCRCDVRSADGGLAEGSFLDLAPPGVHVPPAGSRALTSSTTKLAAT